MYKRQPLCATRPAELHPRADRHSRFDYASREEEEIPRSPEPICPDTLEISTSTFQLGDSPIITRVAAPVTSPVCGPPLPIDDSSTGSPVIPSDGPPRPHLPSDGPQPPPAPAAPAGGSGWTAAALVRHLHCEILPLLPPAAPGVPGGPSHLVKYFYRGLPGAGAGKHHGRDYAHDPNVTEGRADGIGGNGSGFLKPDVEVMFLRGLVSPLPTMETCRYILCVSFPGICNDYISALVLSLLICPPIFMSLGEALRMVGMAGLHNRTLRRGSERQGAGRVRSSGFRSMEVLALSLRGRAENHGLSQQQRPRNLWGSGISEMYMAALSRRGQTWLTKLIYALQTAACLNRECRSDQIRCKGFGIRTNISNDSLGFHGCV